MKLLDWILVILPMLIVVGIGICTQSSMKSVADLDGILGPMDDNVFNTSNLSHGHGTRLMTESI